MNKMSQVLLLNSAVLQDIFLLDLDHPKNDLFNHIFTFLLSFLQIFSIQLIIRILIEEINLNKVQIK